MRLRTALMLALLGAPVLSWALAAKSVPTLTPLPADAAQNPRLVLLKKLLTTANDAPAGEASTGLFCAGARPLKFNTALTQPVSLRLGKMVRQRLEAASYPVPVARSAFDSEQSPKQEADFELGITFKAAEAYYCAKAADDAQGSAWVQARWELYAPKLQKVVLDLTTEGSYQTVASDRMTQTDLFEKAFSNAFGNLMAQSAWFDAVHGRSVSLPASAPTAASAPGASASSPATAALVVKGAAEPLGATDTNYLRLVAGTVTVSVANASGSGFFVSQDGHVLTNQHVVGSNKFVKLRLSDGSEQSAEVLRIDSARDVALLKLSAPTPNALFVMPRLPSPGEEVYAIGSPLGKTYAGTITKGISSGKRQLNGKTFIQSDVRILPGSSGGPLFDARSRVIGITVSGLNAGTAGINLFIPVQEALSALALDVE